MTIPAIPTTEATPATERRFALAEGPVWDAPRRRLLWVDIIDGAVLEGTIGGAPGQPTVEVTAEHRFAGMVGAVAVADDGTLLVAAQERPVVIEPDGTRIDGPAIVPVGSGRRLNDAGIDPAGRLVVGTLSMTDTAGSEQEELVRLEDDGRVTGLDADLRLSNGLAWSADGTRLFSVDSLRHTIAVRPYDAATGATGRREIHLEVTDGIPDGIAVDAEEHLWVAVYGAGEVRRYAPDGTLVARITTPAPHTTSLAFVGDDRRTVLITTGYGELTPEERAAHPESGRLFAARVEVPGLAVPSWNGRGVDRDSTGSASGTGAGDEAEAADEAGSASGTGPADGAVP